jgi:hypothetical protein
VVLEGTRAGIAGTRKRIKTNVLQTGGRQRKLHVTCSWKEEVYFLSDVPSDIRGVPEYCDIL